MPVICDKCGLQYVNPEAWRRAHLLNEKRHRPRSVDGGKCGYFPLHEGY